MVAECYAYLKRYDVWAWSFHRGIQSKKMINAILEK
jgi:hypothetical protein